MRALFYLHSGKPRINAVPTSMSPFQGGKKLVLARHVIITEPARGSVNGASPSSVTITIELPPFIILG